MKRKIIGSVLALAALASAALFGSKVRTSWAAAGLTGTPPEHLPTCRDRNCPGCKP
ncbi:MULTISPECIES: hypothetical protein [unclassified Streptomyces]|uniref:hypothetical protein n=1 Tax=unclassified Streptomyces TaxID=2593676 RepID=UPI0035DE68D1